jgi:hypothetical protein
LKALALAALAMGASGLAQAESSYYANFALEQYPTLWTDAANDSDRVTSGKWTMSNHSDTLVRARDLLGATTDPVTAPVTGELALEWGDWVAQSNMHRAGGPPFGFGSNTSIVTETGYPRDQQSVGGARVNQRSLGASITLHEPYGEGHAQATWDRSFELNAHSSITFSGIAGLGIETSEPSASAFQESFTLNDTTSFAGFAFADINNRVRTSVGASIFSAYTGNLGDIVDFDTDGTGRVTMTITNNFDTAMTGSLQVGSFVDVIATPVPEPEAYLSMIVGLGLIGAIARRKTKAAAPALTLA